MGDYELTLNQLRESGNFRSIPKETERTYLDFSTNDYMGLGARIDLQKRFFENLEVQHLPLSSSAARLLAAHQKVHTDLEQYLGELYGREVLLYNTGYHANTGTISALAAKNTFVIVDRLSHASIIDGVVLSRAEFTRFRHNDYTHLEKLLEVNADKYRKILIVTESVFSMDGDTCDVDKLVELKRKFASRCEVLLYIDEAHAFGVNGPHGLGLCKASSCYDEVDVIVGTFGKAAASQGAFVAASSVIKEYLVNKSRSFIFSTALPPFNSAWTQFVLRHLVAMDAEREHLQALCRQLSAGIEAITGAPVVSSHIIPLIVGDAHKAVEVSKKLEEKGVKALAIRTPTVPPGTERIRFSVSAAMTAGDIHFMLQQLKELL